MGREHHTSRKMRQVARLERKSQNVRQRGKQSYPVVPRALRHNLQRLVKKSTLVLWLDDLVRVVVNNSTKEGNTTRRTS